MVWEMDLIVSVLDSVSISFLKIIGNVQMFAIYQWTFHCLLR